LCTIHGYLRSFLVMASLLLREEPDRVALWIPIA
jgi:hypothetical protein